MTRRKYKPRSAHQQGEDLGSVIADLITLMVKMLLLPFKWLRNRLHRRPDKK